MKRRLALPALALVLTLVAAACGSGGSDGGGGSAAADTPDTTAERTATTAADTSEASASTCESVTATYRDVTSANPDLPDPELSVSCTDDVVTVQTNAIPDYEYVQTTPGDLEARSSTFNIPVIPTEPDTPGEIPRVGPSAVAVNGVPIFGPTEATGGDVTSLQGALSECGSHNGPPGFHMHLFGWAEGVDCLYDAADVEDGEPVLVGWSLDGYPIMSGVVCADDDCTTTKQLKSSWQLTNESLFATDTWSAHEYVEGSGDLDECNGRVDEDGQYRYYTTTTFPYFMGCYRGEVLADSGAGGGNLGPGGGQVEDGGGPPPGA